MKKLFLTSGIIACMACPAFADPTGFAPINGTTVTNPVADACVEGVLGATSGDVQLQAQWQANFTAINLDKNTDNGGNSSAANIDPAQLWAVIGSNGGVYDTYSGTIGQADFTPVRKVNSNGTIGMTAPDGITTTYTFATTTTNGRTPSGSASATTPIRQLTEFNSSADGTGTTYISVSADNQTFTLTSDGTTAAQNATVGTPLTWYAQYACATPAINSTLALDGYTFDHWENASGQTVPAAGLCETAATQQLTAVWNPVQYTISFNCGTTGTSTPTLSGDSSVSIYMDAGTTITQACASDGYVFTGWTCTSNAGHLTAEAYNSAGFNSTAITTITASNQAVSQQVYLTTAGDVSCTATWRQNTIDLHWNANNADTITTTGGNSCTYDDAVVVPEVSRTGYILTGWDVVTYQQPGVNTANTTTQP